MKDIKGYKTIKNKEFKLKELNAKKERLAKSIARLDFDDYERIVKKGKQLKELEAQIEKISEELKKYVSLEHLDEEENINDENDEIKDKEEDTDNLLKNTYKDENLENVAVEDYENHEQKDFEEFKAEKIVSIREILKGDDELDKTIEKSIEDDDKNAMNQENRNDIKNKKFEKRAANAKQKTDIKAKRIKEKADKKINEIQTKINNDKEKRKKCEEKLEELKNAGVVKIFAVKIADEENNKTAIKKFEEDLEAVKQHIMEIELELRNIQSRIVMNQLRQSEIRKETIEKIEIREAIDSLNKSAFGRAWIYIKAAGIAIARSTQDTLKKIKDKINEISKKSNNPKLNPGNEEDTKIYEPKIKKENQIKSKYSQKIDYTRAYNNISKESDGKETTEDYRD